MNIIDLRSDTVTHPTPAMREAMAKSPVGDDVYGEDPTVNRLQEMAAAMLGQEAGLLVPSGTMGNLASIMAHCGRGDEIIMGTQSHTYLHEVGGYAALGGIHSCQLPNQKDGTLSLEDIRAAIREPDVHHPVTRLIELENTQNHCGGVPLTVEYTQAVVDLAHSRGIKVHLDGARIFNAAVALGVPADKLTSQVDSVTFCLSKGLCAPGGSVICGSKAFISRVLSIRKQLGGGMRQAGILAAAGIVALESMIERLEEDHRRAKKLAQRLADVPGLVLDESTPHTNMIFFRLAPDIRLSTEELVVKLRQQGVLIGAAGVRYYRLVTHYWIDDAAVDQAVSAFNAVMGALP